MSTQLILYPQSHKGSYSSTGSVYSFLVDSISFLQINSSTSYDATNTPSNLGIKQAIVFQNASGIIVNTWYRVRSNWTGSPALPVQSSGDLVLDSVSPGSFCGVYQRLSNLVVGGVYNVTVDMTAVAGSNFYIQSFNGTTLNPMTGAAGSTNVATVSYTFTAQSPTDIVAFWQSSSITSSLTISKISITTSVIDPTQVFTDLQDGQVICDLYQEEDIPLTLSIDDFKNVAEKVQSYSKDFDLPATKRNNQIFNNMFEVTRADDGLIFNPYVRTKCVLKQDGFVLFEGYLRLTDVKDKEGEISYNVNLYSEVIAMADLLKEVTFSNLDFSELTHLYNKTSIKDSWYNTGGLPLIDPLTDPNEFAGPVGAVVTQVLKYPFIDWTHQYIIGGTNNPPGSALIGKPELTSLEQSFRPCIQLKYLINKIFADAGFTWTSNFFDSADFGKLFMDFNWGADNGPVQFDPGGNSFSCWNGLADKIATTSFSPLVLDNTGVAAFVFPSNYDPATNIITATINNETYDILYSYEIENTDSVTRTVECRWLKNTTAFDYTGVITLAAGAIYTYASSISFSGNNALMIGDTLGAEFKASSAGVVVQTLYGVTAVFGTTVTFVVGIPEVTSTTLAQTLRGELGQWDFLKGIMTMFNLITMVDELNPDNILIEPYNDVFINNTVSGTTSNLTLAARSIQHDWTDKIDASEMELKPLTDLNKNTIFKFVEDDDDYIFNVFKKAQSGHLYGSLKFDASTSTNGLPTILEGTKEIIAEPFAATVSKPLDDQFTSFIVPTIYAMTDDGTEGFDNSPRIFYNNGRVHTGASYFIPEQNGLSNENQEWFLQFSHLSDIPTIAGSRDFVFKSEQLVAALGSPPVDNLFLIYWSPYFNELYNADTRTMTLKVNLSASDIASFKFYDTVFIKNRSFRVNKIEYKPNSLAKVEFILIP
jgi:hypothetical protein